MKNKNLKNIAGICLMLVFSSMASLVQAQFVNIPDPTFKSLLVSSPNINTNGNGEIEISEAAAYSGAIDVSFQGISDLTGIEAFVSLTELNCKGNPLFSLDVSSCSNLINLDCSECGMFDLNLSDLSSLLSINCGFNSLPFFNLSGNTSLQYLSCQVNSLTDLDVSAYTSLEALFCENNLINSLDVSNKPSLIFLYCERNNINSLDVSSSLSLQYLFCQDNQLNTLVLGNSIGFADFLATGNPSLSCIQVNDPSFMNSNWSGAKDPGTIYSINCSAPTPSITSTTSFTSGCAGSSFSVGFTASDFSPLSGNSYQVQLSDASGSFASPVQIGASNNNTSVSGNISVTLPAGTPSGSGYRVRVVSTNPAVTGSPISNNLSISGTVVPSVVLTANPSGAVCSGASITFTATPSNGGNAPVFNFTVGGNSVQSGSSNTFSSSSLSHAQVVAVTMTSNAACASSTTANSNTITLNITPSASYYTDADADGFGSSSDAGVSSCSPIAGRVTNNGDCNDANATVYPGAPEICDAFDNNCDGFINEGLGSNSTLNISACNSYTWSVNGNTYTTGGTYLSPNSCGTDSLVLNILQSPTSPTAISGPAGVCRGQNNVVFSVLPVAGATQYNWVLPAGASGTSTSNSISVNFNNTYNTGNISVSAVGSCGSSAPFSRSVVRYSTVPATPGIISGASDNVCGGSSLVYSVPQASDVTYNWVVPSGCTLLNGQGTNTVTLLFSNGFTSGNISVSATNCFGSSANRTLAVRGIPATPGNITGTSNPVCAGTSPSYSIAAVPGASSYNWTVPAGVSIVSGQGTTSVVLSIQSGFVSGNIGVRAVSNCGSSGVKNLALSAGSLSQPSSISGQQTNLCGGNPYLYSISPAGGATSYTWSVSPGATFVNPTPLTCEVTFPSSAYTGNISVTANNACGSSLPRKLLVNTAPSTPGSFSAPASICAGQQGVVFSALPVNGASNLQWQVPSGASIVSGQGSPSITVNFGSTTGFVRVRAVNACASGTLVSRLISFSCREEEDGTEQVQEEEQIPLQEESNGTFFRAYPNPANDKLMVSCDEQMVREHAAIFMVDLSGRLVWSGQITGANTEIDLLDLPKGTYILSIQKSEVAPLRIVKW